MPLTSGFATIMRFGSLVIGLTALAPIATDKSSTHTQRE